MSSGALASACASTGGTTCSRACAVVPDVACIRVMYKFSRDRFGIICVTTVAENEALFSKREVGDARKTRDLSRKLHFLSLQQLVKIVKRMENCPITITDVYHAA